MITFNGSLTLTGPLGWFKYDFKKKHSSNLGLGISTETFITLLVHHSDLGDRMGVLNIFSTNDFNFNLVVFFEIEFSCTDYGYSSYSFTRTSVRNIFNIQALLLERPHGFRVTLQIKDSIVTVLIIALDVTLPRRYQVM